MEKQAHPELIRLVKEGRLGIGQTLLIGTDEGLEAVYLLERGYDVVGVDPDPAVVLATRETVSTHGFFGYFQTGQPSQLPVEDGYFDSVCDFLGAPESEIRRVLKRKGFFVRLQR